MGLPAVEDVRTQPQQDPGTSPVAAVMGMLHLQQERWGHHRSSVVELAAAAAALMGMHHSGEGTYPDGGGLLLVEVLLACRAAHPAEKKHRMDLCALGQHNNLAGAVGRRQTGDLGSNIRRDPEWAEVGTGQSAVVEPIRSSLECLQGRKGILGGAAWAVLQDEGPSLDAPSWGLRGHKQGGREQLLGGMLDSRLGHKVLERDTS
ncbi:hypothetical protein BC830DRAFT_1120931 [Chytriomyces sp. MP71]|nr:hypothetical protein BC830DRAFT_1120931 [Chytriomyces sp. MP71]